MCARVFELTTMAVFAISVSKTRAVGFADTSRATVVFASEAAVAAFVGLACTTSGSFGASAAGAFFAT
jgi:hypothetical protein